MAKKEFSSPMSYDMKVRSITKVEREKEDSNTTKYRMMARDKDGVNEIVIVSGSPFRGINVSEGVIQVIVKNSQMSIEDFKDEPEESKE